MIMDEVLVGLDSFSLARHQKKTGKAGKSLDSVEEINQLARYFYDNGQLRDACMYILQCNTGMRIGDILDFKWKECIYKDKHSGEIRAYGWNAKVENKTDKLRDIYFNKSTAAAVYLHWLHSGKPPFEEYMFCGSRGSKSKAQHMTVRSASRIMTHAAQQAGLWRPDRKVSTHAIRKTALSAVAGLVDGAELSDATIRQLQGLKLAQAMGNHSDGGITNRHYLDIQNRILRGRSQELELGLDAILEYVSSHRNDITKEFKKALA